MALRSKSIVIPIRSNTADVASAVVWASTSETVVIPEVTSRVFRNVTAELFVRTNEVGASGTTITARVVGLSVNGVVSDASKTGTNANITTSGEHASFVWQQDFTSHFATNYTGTSHAVILRGALTGPVSNHHAGRVYITYEYNDTDVSRSKTVMLPFGESTATTLGTSLVTIGTIPNLDTTLPEAGKTYRHIMAYAESYTATNATTNWNYQWALDGGGANNLGTLTEAGNSPLTMHIYVNLSFTTNATHTMQWATTQASRGTNFWVMLLVTYTYTSTSTTSVMVSVQLPACEEGGFSGGTAVGDASRSSRNFYIPEPTTITMSQCALILRYNARATVTSVLLKIGTQAYRTYTHTHGAAASAGYFSIMQRWDSGGVQGAGLTLAQGANAIQVDWYSTATTAMMNNTSGTQYINYTCGIPGAGIEAVNHTHYWNCDLGNQFTEGSGTYRSLNRISPLILQVWFLNAVGVMMLGNMGGQNAGISISFEVLTGEPPAGDGWTAVYSSIYNGNLERGIINVWAKAGDELKRFALDPDEDRVRLIKNSSGDTTYDRYWKIEISGPGTLANLGVPSPNLMMTITGHAINGSVNGTVSNSAGGTVYLSAHDVETGEVLGVATRAGNGFYNIDTPFKFKQAYVEAWESTTKTGRSANGATF